MIDKMSSSKYLAAQQGVLFVVVAQGFKKFPTFIDLFTRAHYRSVSELDVSGPHSYTLFLSNPLRCYFPV